MRKWIVAALLLAASHLPASAQEREWNLDAQDEDAYLVFGVPESDDVGASFWCKLGSGKVKLFFPEGGPGLKPGTTTNFAIIANGKTFDLPGSTADNELLGTVSIETETTISDAIIAALRAADRFTARIGGHDTIFPLLDSGFEDLVKLCQVK